MAATGTVSTMIWSKLATEGFVPEARTGHSACVVPLPDGSHSMVVFGGVVGGSRVNTVNTFNYDTKTWALVETFGDAPSPRCGHAAFVHKGCVYVHGGEVSVEGGVTRLPAPRGSTTSLLPSEAGTIRACADDMYKLDCESMVWSTVPVGLAPLPRKGHTIAVLPFDSHPTAVLLGRASTGSEWDNSVYTMALDAEGWRRMWTKVLMPPPGSDTTTQWPCARQGHSFTQVSHNKIVMFGGSTHTGTLLNDVFVFTTDAAVLANSRVPASPPPSPWQRMACHGRPPLPRHSHTSVYVPACAGKRPPSLIVYGGVATQQDQLHYPKEIFTLDLASCVWSVVSVGHLYPSARAGHSLVACPPVTFTHDDKPVYILFGGSHTMYCTSDVWQLRVRRRRSRFYSGLVRHSEAVVSGANTDGTMTNVSATKGRGDVLDADVDSGSDDEDWVVADPEDADAPEDDEGGRGVLTWKGGDGSRGLNATTRSSMGTTGTSTVTLEDEVLKLRKQLIRTQEQHAAEVGRRRKCEEERDEAVRRAEELTAALVAHAAAADKEKHDLTQMWSERVDKAEMIASQATADLVVVTRLLTLHDAMADLRLEGWKAHAARVKSGGEGQRRLSVSVPVDDPHVDDDTAGHRM